ncbi:MAG: ABC transporter ATP-binding protein [Bdellovibrionales bacterium]|nr:ABC transporter ATP-binding protein [Bdellovibrionales bacterium]
MKFLKPTVTLDGALEGESPNRIWWNHLAKHRGEYALGIFSVVLTNIADVILPKYFQWSVDALSQNSARFLHYLAPMAGFLALQFMGRIFWRQTLGQQTHYVAAKLRSQLWNRARFFPRERLETDLTPGELMNVATSDIGLARFMFGFTIVGTVDFFFLLTLTVAAMLTVDAKLTLATLAILPAVPFMIDRISRREAAQHRVAQSALSKLTDLVAQAVATQRLQRVSGTHRFWEAKLGETANEYRGKRFEVAKTSLAFIPVTGVAPLISFAALLALGMSRVLAGTLTIGEFIAMQSYIFIIQTPMLELGSIISEWQRGFASFERVTRTLAQPEASGLRAGGATPLSQEVILTAKDLSFRYPGAERDVFSKLSFELRAGRRLGVTGPIGAGKTTLLEILSGLQRGFTGQVLFHGRDIRELSHAEMRRQISVVPQRPFLFGDTVRSNMALDRQLTDDEIWHWLDVAGVREDIAELPDQLNTKLGEWGVNLSGGQKQRLTLARALARKPQVLLLDDCLSAVDTVTEERILRALDRELQHATLVWVAHRASTLRHCTDLLELGT